MIRLTAITRTFHMGDQAVYALNNINLHIASGEYVSIMGPSGSGKSTLLNIVGLLDKPDSGSYELDDRLITDLSETEQAQIRREKIGFVFQSFHLIPRLTAAENIELPLILSGMPSEQRQSLVNDALQAFELKERAHHRPAELSGGQRQRVAIARATIMHPSVILADEPTGNLDHQIGAEVMLLLENLHHTGTTLIVVTYARGQCASAHRQIGMRDANLLTDQADHAR